MRCRGSRAQGGIRSEHSIVYQLSERCIAHQLSGALLPLFDLIHIDPLRATLAWAAGAVAIYGDKGVLRSNKAWNNENQPVSVHAEYQGGDASTYDFAPTDQFGLQLRHLCDCLEKEIPHRIPPQNSIHQMQVIDALFRSIESGQAETP